MFCTRVGQLIDQGPGGIHEALLMDFGRTIRLTKLGTFMGSKCLWIKGLKCPLNDQSIPPFSKFWGDAWKVHVVRPREMLQGQSSSHPLYLVQAFSSDTGLGPLYPIFIRPPGVHLTGRFQLKVSPSAWRKVWEVEVISTLASKAGTWPEIKPSLQSSQP